MNKPNLTGKYKGKYSLCYICKKRVPNSIGIHLRNIKWKDVHWNSPDWACEECTSEEDEEIE